MRFFLYLCAEINQHQILTINYGAPDEGEKCMGEKMDFLVTNPDGTISGNCFGNALNSNNENSILSLKDNPMFQLSLASKELFHSNFLLWLAQDPELKEVFEKIIQFFSGDSNFTLPDQYVALREKDNMDFCICEVLDKEDNTGDAIYLVAGKNTAESEGKDQYITKKQIGKYVFILENKFKSIATNKQLVEYTQKVITTNSKLSGKSTERCENNQPKFTLLSLADNFLGKTEIEKNKIWNVVSYRDYAETITGTLSKVSNENKKNYIEDYCNFISIISQYVNSELNSELKRKLCWGDMFRTELYSLRINDIWQKLVVSKFLSEHFIDFNSNSELENMIEHPDSFYKGYYYGTGGASICIYVPFKYENVQYFYHISIQGNQYRRGILIDKMQDDKKTILDWLNNNEGPFGFLNVQNVLLGKGGKKNYNTFSGKWNFYYKYRKMNNEITLNKLANFIMEDIKNFKDWGRNNKLSISIKGPKDKKIEEIIKQYGKNSIELTSFLRSCSGNIEEFIELCEKWESFDKRTQDVYVLATDLARAYYKGITDDMSYSIKIDRLQKAVKYYDIALESPMASCKQSRAGAYALLQKLLNESPKD